MTGPLAAVLMTVIASTLANTPASVVSPAARSFDAPAQGFSVAFPASPQLIGHAPKSDDDAGYWIYAVRDGGASFTVRIDQYPSRIHLPAPDQQTYDLLLRAHAGESSSRLRAVNTVAVAGLGGLEGDFVGKTGDEKVRVVMVGRRVYQVSYAATVGECGEQGDAFLASFQIDPN